MTAEATFCGIYSEIASSSRKMTRFSTLLVSLLSFVLACTGQTEPIEIVKNDTSNHQYKDFIVENDSLWALTTDGKLLLIDLNTGDTLPDLVQSNQPILVLTKDRQGNIIVGDKNRSIKKYENRTNSWTILFKYSNNLLGIAFDSKNNYYLITNRGIFDIRQQKTYYPDSSLNYQIRHETGWSHDPVYITDKNDNIWIGFGYGEWGGDLFIFNTKDKKFTAPRLKDFEITLNPIKSIFESPDNVFVTSGLMHFSTSGSIVRFDKFRSQVIFKSDSYRKFPDNSTNHEMAYGEYIGPGAYNPEDSCIYFYSQNGIFKGNPARDLSKIENWTKVLQPKLRWSNGQPDAAGSPMNVLKLQFVSPGKLVFVSQYDGIGIFNGKSLIMAR